MKPPAAESAAAYVKATNGDMIAQSTPTTALEAKSPTPFMVCSTPNPVPLDSDGNRSAAAVPSRVSVIAVKKPATRKSGTNSRKSGVRRAVPMQANAEMKYPAARILLGPILSLSAPIGNEEAA